MKLHRKVFWIAHPKMLWSQEDRQNTSGNESGTRKRKLWPEWLNRLQRALPGNPVAKGTNMLKVFRRVTGGWLHEWLCWPLDGGNHWANDCNGIQVEQGKVSPGKTSVVYSPSHMAFGRDQYWAALVFGPMAFLMLVLRSLPLETVLEGDTGFVQTALEPCVHSLSCEAIDVAVQWSDTVPKSI